MTRALLATILVLAACSGGGDSHNTASGSWVGTTRTSGDTTTITTTSGTTGGRHVLDSVRVLWQSDDLDRPTQLLLVGSDRIAIADRTRIHLIGTDGTAITTAGREGEGPGEFEQLGAIGAGGDMLYALDRGNRHWARFDRDGALLGSGVLDTHGDLIGLSPGRIALAGDTVSVGWNALLRFDGSPSSGGVVDHVAGGAPAERARVFGSPYVMGPSGTASLGALFGPTARFAVAPSGMVALSDGVEYCVWMLDHRTRRICRDWERVPVTDAIRTPDFDAVIRESGVAPEVMGPLREVLPLVAVGDRRYALAGLNFDSENRLWVQAVDSLTADVHPILIRFTPDRRPAYRHWDVFDGEGRLLWELFLPSTFTPWDARGNLVYGFQELESGELAVGVVRVP